MEFGKPTVESMGLIADKFWHGKRVFLTGHTGFKGSWLALWLQRMGADVTGYALNPATAQSLYDLAQVGREMLDIRGDVRDCETLHGAMISAKPEIVIHLAAQALVRASYSDPVDTYSTNVMGTVNVLDVVRRTGGVRALLIVTSDKCYENREWVWGYREIDAMGGFDPYSSSKGCAELVTTAYRKSYFRDSETAVASARSGNVIGGGDWADDRLVPDIMRAAMEGKTVHIRNPGAIRPWQHVLEPLYGYLMLAERLYLDGQEFAEGWNFGPGENEVKSVEWVVQELASLYSAIRWVKDVEPHPHEARHLKLDCSKARLRLHWAARLTLGEALSWTAKWYQSYQKGSDVRLISTEQLTTYTKLCKQLS